MIASESSTPNSKGVIPANSDAQSPDMETLEHLLLQAVTMHQAGQVDEAARLYLDVLKVLPTQANANHNLGVIALEAKDVDASLALFKIALEAAPEDPQFWISYIEALLQAEQYEYAAQVLAHGIDGGLQGDEVESLKQRLANAQSISQPINQSRQAEAAPSKAPEQSAIKAKKNGKPSFNEMNALATMFNQGRLAESEPLALRITQRYPRHGFGWKVLGAIRQQQGLMNEAFQALKMAAEYLPGDSEAHYNLGNYYYDQGQLAAATSCYQKAVRIEPGFAKAHYNLGSVQKDQKQFAAAEASYKKALKISPNNAQMHFNLAVVLNEQGRFDEAEASFRSSLALNPNDAEAYYSLGGNLNLQGRLDEAKDCYIKTIALDAGFAEAYCCLSIIYQYAQQYELAEATLRKAIAVKPEFAMAHFNLGNRLREQNRLEEAAQSYRNALAFSPNHAETYNNLGLTLKELAQLEEAETCYRKAIELSPEYSGAYNNLSACLKELIRIPEAIACSRRAIELCPDAINSLNNLGVMLYEEGSLDEAESVLKQAIAIDPHFAKAYSNLGAVYDAQLKIDDAVAFMQRALAEDPNLVEGYNNLGRFYLHREKFADAEVNLLRAIEIKPDYFEAYSNMGSACMLQGRLEAAVDWFRKALAINPRYNQALSNLLFCITHNPTLDKAAIFAEHKTFGERFETPLISSWPQLTNSKDKQRRLKIGFVSGDFRNHPVAFFIEPVLEHLAQNPGLSLHAYSNTKSYDKVSIRIREHFNEWTNTIHFSDEAFAKQIQQDGIDILMDLSGHTAGHRLLTFARKPAPVQASWIGCPSTTGLTAMDYYLADSYLLPPGQLDDQFTEKLVQLPASAPFLPAEYSPAINALPALSNKHFTFASFNRPSKLSQSVIALWAKVLRAVPDSKMLLGAMQQDEGRAKLLSWFEQEGISADRLILRTRSEMHDYLKMHQEVDLCMDTFPYNGGTTTWHAIWMGVPTLTLAGDMLPSRIGAGILGHVGLGDFVVTSQDEFVQKAIYWTQHLELLAQHRASMRERFAKSAPGQPAVIANGLAAAFRTMWHRWCDGAPAASFEVHLPEDESGAVTAFESIEKDITPKAKAAKPEITSLEIVSATRMSEQQFWNESALGQSLQRFKDDARISASIAFENTRGLPEVFNERIDQAQDDAVLIFMHDDVWIDEPNFLDAILAGLEHFDVLGVAGNRRRVANQPSWNFTDIQFNWDTGAHLSGRVGHGQDAGGRVLDFGPTPNECELLDGVFLAVRAGSLKPSSLREQAVQFDPQFDFHFYDMDFCRSARNAGLTLGTWPIRLTHQSEGAFGSQLWRQKYARYLDKWDAVTKHEVAGYLSETSQKELELQQAMNEVLQLALHQQKEGELELATKLYLEILNIQPRHAEANHNLGVIEAELKGAALALPRLEIAVTESPANEQFWVTYIDALMQSGAVDTAASALLFGQQHGLTAETAHILAAEFEIDLEAVAKSQQDKADALQAAVLEALQQPLTASNKCDPHPIKDRANATPVFYIWAPNYSDFSSGTKCLHILCDRLNKAGYEAYVTSAIISDHLKTPQINSELIQAHKLADRLQIAIYPEVVMGNPLAVPNVVRYLLNKPNFFLKTSWFGSFHKDEHILHYDDSFAIPWVASEGVRVQTVDRSLFTPPTDPNTKRSGFLVYSHRVAPDLDSIPDWCRPFEVISMAYPKPPQELARLYQQAEGLIVYHKTAAAVEALLCGCPVIYASGSGLDKSEVFYNGYDDFAAAWNFDKAGYAQMQQSIASFPTIYDANEKPDFDALESAIGNILTHFKTIEPDALETTPAYGLAIAGQYAQHGDIPTAIIAYRQLIIDHPDCVEAYYRMAETLEKVGLKTPALEILLQGQPYLQQLPTHEYLASVIAMYEQKVDQLRM
ncbi:MAG TPA: tetratricopeptide repeat protein [Methylophilaceae bacterium]|nr:tetratricopeptide repeat protein [Methylophilaceae bacterium]